MTIAVRSDKSCPTSAPDESTTVNKGPGEKDCVSTADVNIMANKTT